MVFNPPTLLNYTSADLYSYERRKIQQYNLHLRFRPEIMSHTYIEIYYYDALVDNVEIPWYRKIRFVVRSRKKFCKQTTCQSHYPRGQTCGPETEPQIFKTGDQDMESCQFGCYNLYEKTILPQATIEQEDAGGGDGAEEEEREAAKKKRAENEKTEITDEMYTRAPFLIYSHAQCACTVHENGYFALGIDDYARTDEHPTPRVDTIGTGFHYSDSGNFFDDQDFSPTQNPPFTDLQGDESFRFLMNKYYCDDFMLKFNGRKCYQSTGEKVFGFLVSEVAYKAVQYGVRYAKTGVNADGIQKLNLPPIKHKPSHETFASWKDDVDESAFFIDPNVNLTDLGFTENQKHCIFTTEYGYPGKLVEPLAFGKNTTGNLVDYEQRNVGRLHQFKYDVMTGRRVFDEYEIYGIYKYLRSNPTEKSFNGDNYTNPDNILTGFFVGLIENFDNIASMMALTYVVDKGTEFSKEIMTTAADRLEGKITASVVHLVERELASQAMHPVMRIFGRALVMLLRTSVSLLKLIDVLAITGMILDFLDMIFDFFNMNRVMDDGSVRQYSEMDIATIRSGYGFGTAEYSPVTFMLMCEYLKLQLNWQVTPTSINRLQCIRNKDYEKYKYMLPVDQVVRYDVSNSNSYEWVSEYIFSLKVNSNGLNINWDDEPALAPDVVDQYLNIDENIILKGMDEYSQYSKRFRKRVKYSEYTLIVLVVLLLVIILIQLNVAALFIFIAAISAIYLVFSYFLDK